jgi:ribokinase
MRTAVVGHVEWVTFARVPRVPAAGEIAHATDWWEEPAGGGAVAAVQLARLSGHPTLYTALGHDDLGRRAVQELRRLGVRVEAASREDPQRRAFTFVDDAGERTITTVGRRLAPSGADPLPWPELSGTDAVYLTAGDRAAIHAARGARVLAATSRILPDLRAAGVPVDALIGSARDPAEAFEPGDLDPQPRLVVRTEGLGGGRWWTEDGDSGTYDAVPRPGPPGDSYGAGDSFAAGLTHALGAGMSLPDALSLAARCGAVAVTGRGAYGRQLTAEEI